MNRNEYISKLRLNLQGISSDDLEDILSDYEEHFQIGLSKGKTEQEISSELGDPYDIANNYKTQNRSFNGNMNQGNNNVMGKLLMVVLLGFFNLIIVFGPYMAIVFGGLVALYGTSIGILFGGVASFFAPLFGISSMLDMSYNIHPITGIAFGIGLISLGILLLILAVYLTKLAYNLTVKYIKWNISVIEKGGF